MQRICYVHAGTHKTGTTSIQWFLYTNRELLVQAGICVPFTGRIPDHDGHHNIPWELMGDERYNPTTGNLESVLAEIVASNVNVACVSSEEFSFLHSDVAAIAKLRDGFASIGFETRFLFYLRPQLDFARAMWAELTKQGDRRPLWAHLEATIATGSIGEKPRESTLEYDKLLDAFAGIVGAENLVVRRFPDSSARPVALISDFFRIVREKATIVNDVTVSVPARVNVSAIPTENELAVLKAYAEAIETRFAPHREATRARYGIDVPAIGDVLDRRDIVGKLEALIAKVG